MNKLWVEVAIKPILDQAKFDLAPGQIVALVGPNGSGKSSLLASILGMSELRATGTINYKNKNLLDLSTSKIAQLGVGIVNQQSVVIKNVTLRQVLLAIGPSKQAKIEKIAQDLAITHLLDRDLNTGFSGGEMRRAELAQLIIQDPELVLIDELDAGVDVDSRKIIYRYLRQWLKNKMAVIVSHDFEIYQQLKIDQVLLIKNKKLVAKPVSYLAKIKQDGYDEK